MVDHELRVLRGSGAASETQHCHLSGKLIHDIGGRLASPALIAINENFRTLCTLWPRRDKHDGFIQLSDLVILQKDEHLNVKHTTKLIKLTDIEIINSVGVVRLVHVDIVLNDYTKVQSWKKSNSTAKFKVTHILRNLVLCSGCQVKVKQTPLGNLFGISWIKVKSIGRSGNRNLKYGRCDLDTDVVIEQVMSLERFEQKINKFAFLKQLGGISREFKLLKELIELPKYGASTRNRLKLPQGVLLQGPPGCGKTSLVYHLAKETDSYLEVISGSEMFGSRPGETEQNLRTAFEKVEIISKEGPCIISLEEVDSFCPAKGHGVVEKRVTSQLLSLIDWVTSTSSVIVIGATNNAGSLDASIRRPGRLEKEVLIGVPNLQQRKDILAVLTTTTVLDSDVDLSILAESTPGYVGADLESLVQQAHYAAVTEWLKYNTKSMENMPQVIVRSDHFKAALHNITPSTQRGSDILVDYKPVTWQEIGGLDDVKVKLKQTVEWPLKHPEAFRRLGIPQPRGILLYGPPGCGKTKLVRAIATSCHVTFLAISGGQLYSPYVGDSEHLLRQAFQQARSGAPSVLFIDELDSVIGSRSQGSCRSDVQERVLSTLLNEMDGIGMKSSDIVRTADRVAEGQHVLKDKKTTFSMVDNTGVLLIAATNRPDMLDEAILRPGRLDHIIYVPPPDKKARTRILKVHTSKMPLDAVDINELAERTVGYTGADLENLCREAALYALTDDGLSTSRVTSHHFSQVLQTMKPSLTMAQIAEYSFGRSSQRLSFFRKAIPSGS